MAHRIVRSLWSTWVSTAQRHPDRAVVIDADSGRSLTCRALTDAAVRLADAFGGAMAGRLIVFSLPNGADWLVPFLAIQKVGGIVAALDPSLQAEALKQTACRLGADFLWQDGSLLPLNCEKRCNDRDRNHRNPVCCLKVTSGTTGDVTPVRCAADHLLADGQQIVRTMGIRPSDRSLAAIPMGHSYGLGNLVMPLVLQATPVVCSGALLPRHLFQVLARHRVTVFPTVPAVLRAVAQTGDVPRPPWLRLVISAGGPLAPDTARQFHRRFGLKIHNFYGASETGGICYDRTGNATLSGRGVGKPLEGVTVSLRSDGRVSVRSKAVASSRGRHVLADLGEWNRYGELRLLGRVGQMANIGGRKVSPLEVENCLRRIAGVSDAWVAPRQDPRGNDHLVAAIETARSLAEIERELGKQLPAWKLPRRYHLTPALPRTDRGKLDTAALRKLL